jgi:hypothetical protein
LECSKRLAYSEREIEMAKKQTGSYILLCVLTYLCGVITAGALRAQTVVPFTIIATGGLHSTCPAVAASTTQYCFATDGIWQSVNGGAYAQVGVPVAAGVTSWNGQTGAVTYTPPAPPVTSVNGKTGAVVLIPATTVTAPTATTTLQ